MKPKDDLPVAIVKELLRVDETGNLFWLKDVAHAAYIVAKRKHHTHHVEKNYAI